MTQTLIVAALIGAAAVYLGRKAWAGVQAARKPKTPGCGPGCGCG